MKARRQLEHEIRKYFVSKSCIVNKIALIQYELHTNQEMLVTNKLSILCLFTRRKLKLGDGGKWESLTHMGWEVINLNLRLYLK